MEPIAFMSYARKNNNFRKLKVQHIYFIRLFNFLNYTQTHKLYLFSQVIINF